MNYSASAILFSYVWACAAFFVDRGDSPISEASLTQTLVSNSPAQFVLVPIRLAVSDLLAILFPYIWMWLPSPGDQS